MEETIELRACPKCRSELFVSSRTGERFVFHMDAKQHPIIVRPELLIQPPASINKQVLHCVLVPGRARRWR